MRNYIKDILIETPAGKENLKIQLISPKDEYNVISLISGENQSGKTHILKYLEQSIYYSNKKETKESLTPKCSNISANLNYSEKLNIFSLFDIRNAKKYLEKVSYQIRNKNTFESTIKKLAYNLLSNELNYFSKTYKIFDFNENNWNNIENPDYKKSIMKFFLNSNKSIYPCNLENLFVKEFEEQIKGKLYIGSDNNQRENELALTFYICYSDSHIYNISDWSEGQKVLFTLLLICYYGNFDVLLIDELENNLHPKYMSKILTSLHEKIPQVIISSHNPHLIFSKFIDQVIYIETKEIKMEKRDILKLNNINKESTQPIKTFKPFDRTIEYLNKDYEKFSKVYNLFNNFDNQLLKLSNSIYIEINEYFIQILKNIYNYEAIGVKSGNHADIQSSKLGEELINLNIQEPKILDYGSGKGRSYLEMKKDFVQNKLENYEYHFWESFQEIREELKISINGNKNTKVLERIEDINKNYYDLIILTNVLHECNPNDFSKILKHVNYALKDNGKIIIVELDPLVSPEKFAVSYSEDEMNSLLNKTGWIVKKTTRISISNKSINAYWILAEKRPNINLSITEIEKQILCIWNNIEEKYILKYEGIDNIDSINNFNSIISTLTILASITSYKNKNWTGYFNDSDFLK